MRNAFADLARQQADVAVRVSTRAHQGDLVAKHVAKLAHAFYASRAYLAMHGRPEGVQNLRDLAIVRGDAGRPSMPGEQTLDAHSSAARVAFRSQSFIARLAAVRDGMGIGVLGCFMGNRERSLVRLPLAVSDPDLNVSLLVHVDLRQNARVRAFSEHTTPPSSPTAPSSREPRRSPHGAAPPAPSRLQKGAPGHARAEGALEPASHQKRAGLHKDHADLGGLKRGRAGSR